MCFSSDLCPSTFLFPSIDGFWLFWHDMYWRFVFRGFFGLMLVRASVTVPSYAKTHKAQSHGAFLCLCRVFVICPCNSRFDEPRAQRYTNSSFLMTRQRIPSWKTFQVTTILIDFCSSYPPSSCSKSRPRWSDQLL